MTKVYTRLLSLAGLLAGATLATACFTPDDFGAGVESEHGEPIVPHESEKQAEVAEPSAAEEQIVEGIIPGTPGEKLEITLPEMAFEAPFDGEPLSKKTLASGVEIQEFVIGTGDVAGENKLVEFSFKGYASATGRQVMGSRLNPAKMAINETTRARDPIAAAMSDGLVGMKVGGKRRVKIPSSIVGQDAPPGRPAMGDLWMTVELVSVADAPVLLKADAYMGEPIASKKLDNGLEIYDYAAGEGEAAKPGDLVVTHYIGQLTDGTEFDTSHSRAEGLPVVIGGGGVIKGFSQGLEGAKVGMLRKIVVPPELGYGAREKGKIPANSTLVFMLQITSVGEAPPRPARRPARPGARPRTPPPANK